jgi:hypothetical protein
MRTTLALRVALFALLAAAWLALGRGAGEGSAVVRIGDGAAGDRAGATSGRIGGAPGGGVGSMPGARDLARALLAEGAPRLVVREGDAPPAVGELELLAAAARRAPVVAALPGEAPRVVARPPVAPRAGRAGALPYVVRGRPGDTLLVRLADAAGPVDSTTVVVGATGEVAGAFRVRPAREGWEGWRVEVVEGAGAAAASVAYVAGAGEAARESGIAKAEREPDAAGATKAAAATRATAATGTSNASGRARRPVVALATVGAWVRDAPPPRVLVLAGPPSWESRFVTCALEEAGAVVTLRQPLGRGLAVATAGHAGPGSRARPDDGAPPTSPDALAAFDAAVVLPGVRWTAAALGALERYVAEKGGGAVAVGDARAAAALGVVAPTAGAPNSPAARRAGPGGAAIAATSDTIGGNAGSGGPRDLAADEIAWTLPAELVPLPAVPGVRSAAAPLPPLLPGAVAGAGADGRDLLALRVHGRGRAAALGILESWRWRMEGGRIEEHRAFWRALVDWLAAGARDPLSLELEATQGEVGVPVTVRVVGAHPDTTAADTPLTLALTRPDGRGEKLALAPAPDGSGALVAAFLPDIAGVYLLALGDAAPLAGLRAEAPSGALTSAAPAGASAAGAPAAHAPPAGAPETTLPDAWARLALLAAESGGAAVPADSVPALVARYLDDVASPEGAWPPLPLLFGLIALVAGAEWTIRRLTGRA